MLKSVLAVGAAGLGAGASGCIDARGSFDQFADRVGFVDASTVDRPPGNLHDITGTFLMVTHAGFETSNSPEYFIQFLSRNTLTINGDTGMLHGEVTPLCTFSTCTERNELPPALASEDTTVAADGTFTFHFHGQLPGGSNPFSGTMQPLDAIAVGTIMSADFYCGAVSGSAAGLDLAGSTFAAYRITDTTPANLPTGAASCPSGGPDAGVDAPPVDAAVDAGIDAAVDAAVDADPTDAVPDA